MKLVSIIMPYHDKEEYLRKSINSVLNQTYKNFELIIIYDDKLKNFPKIKKNIKRDKRIKILINKKRLGVGFSRNRGIKISKGQFIAFIDSDDLWKRNKLKIQLDFMKKNNLEFSHTSYDVINKNDKFLKKISIKKILKYSDLLKSCDVGLSTVIIKRNLIKKNLFPKIKTKEDYVVWLKLAKKQVKIIGLDNNLTKWRRLNNSLSSSIIQKIVDAYRVYRYYENQSIISTIFRIFILSIHAIKK